MIRKASVLAVLALAAAASAQTLHVATSGWGTIRATYRRQGTGGINNPWTLVSTTKSGGIETQDVVTPPGAGDSLYYRSVLHAAVGFEIKPEAPGTRLVSARLLIDGVGSSMSQASAVRVGAFATPTRYGLPTNEEQVGRWSVLGNHAGTPIPLSLDVTSFVSRQLAAQNRFLSFRLGPGTPEDSLRATFTNPFLDLTYAPVPEPASCTALGAGALTLLRRRRKAQTLTR